MVFMTEVCRRPVAHAERSLRTDPVRTKPRVGTQDMTSCRAVQGRLSCIENEAPSSDSVARGVQGRYYAVAA